MPAAAQSGALQRHPASRQPRWKGGGGSGVLPASPGEEEVPAEILPLVLPLGTRRVREGGVFTRLI